ncbi:hypothetical protein [Silvanigrella sp.]|jgi:anthranilate phosphoribosyltransferase|uniref:hypothetical protein n=1 Tax=Silvanigrella sp. TaxID=2024976 RepID=UPI0037CCB00E
MKKIREESNYIINILLNDEITTELLYKIGTNLKPEVLANLVLEIKKQGKTPQNLNEIILSADFPVFDIVGTGGIGGNKLNTSTLVSLFAPNIGFQVIKHGGRSSTGKVGAIDFIEKLGISLESVFLNAAEYFRVTGVVFLAAAYTYPMFAKSAPIRKKMQGPTIFNLLGPLLNPIPVEAKMIGAFNQSIAKKLAETCKILDQKAVIVTSKDAEGYLDEASPFAKTYLYFYKDKEIYDFEIEPFEEISDSRFNIFSDGVHIANDLLSLKETNETQIAKKLIAFNLSILGVLNEFKSCSKNNLNALLIHIPKKIISNYKIILDQMNEHINLVQKRILKINQLKKIHSKSPILVKNNLILSSFKNNISHNSNQIESFFQKEKLLLAEIKLSRPQENFNSDLSIEDRIKSYQNSDAISVVTHPSFSGSIDLLQKVRRLTTKPILAKDFIRTIEEAQALINAGANGILLLQDMLNEVELKTLVEYCNNQNVASFVESSFQIPTIGDFHVLNSRNLFSLEENKGFRDFLIHFSNTKIDSSKIILASSLNSHLEIRNCLSIFKGCIVGSAFMKISEASSIRNFISKCINKKPTIKFCGARTLNDIDRAIELNIDLIGINLIPASKRFIGKNNLIKLIPHLEKIQDKICFITRDDVCLECLKIISHFKSIEQCYSIPMLINRNNLIVSNSQKFLGMNAFLLDSSIPGSGIEEQYPKNLKKQLIPVFASGGIHEQNVLSRLNECKDMGWSPVGIDCATGVSNSDLTAHLDSFSFEKMSLLISRI